MKENSLGIKLRLNLGFTAHEVREGGREGLVTGLYIKAHTQLLLENVQ